jgi:hypothetical protein
VLNFYSRENHDKKRSADGSKATQAITHGLFCGQWQESHYREQLLEFRITLGWE